MASKDEENINIQTSNEKICDLVDLEKPIDQYFHQFQDLETEFEGGFTWVIDNWNNLTSPKHISPSYQLGGYNWKILFFPNGNSNNRNLAIYLEPHPVDDEKDPDWHICAQFSIIISKPGEDSTISLSKTAYHRFSPNETDWGFSDFVDLEKLKTRYLSLKSSDQQTGLLGNGKTLNVSVLVRGIKDPTGVLWHNFINYDSKKETGFVGLKNQGATCYLNSLLQSYFFTKEFRKLVYAIPTANEVATNSVPLALQRAFYLLQTSNQPLDTLELTKSFGWDTGDAFTQHDVQELNRILMECLEQKMKGTSVEGKLNELFVGKMKSYIKCVNVDYESSRVEDFWDIQLNVKGLKGLKNSFENYIEVEMLDGENQYAAEGYGLQDAKKGVVFQSFPPILHLQLKRFEYDFQYDRLIKINDKYEFPDSIDLSPYLENSEKSCIYDLHGVLVHSGEIDTGHYYALIKPGVEDKWFRFDDDRVLRVTKREVFDENFGCERLPDEEVKKFTRAKYQSYVLSRQTSAYMLVYIARSQETEILKNVTLEDVPSYVIEELDKEIKEKERKKKEQEELYLYYKLNIHSHRNFMNYQGFDYSPNIRSRLYDTELHKANEYPLQMKVLKKSKLCDVRKGIYEQFNIVDQKLVNIWTVGYRKSFTLRLNKILPSGLDESTLEDVFEKIGAVPAFNVDLYLEESYFDIRCISKYPPTSNYLEIFKKQAENGALDYAQDYLFNGELQYGILIFIKIFDPNIQKLHGLAHIVTSQKDSLKTALQCVSDLYPDISDQIVEEVQPGLIENIDGNSTYIENELYNGDIITVQRQLRNLNTEFYPLYTNSKDFYSFLRFRIKIRFTSSQSTDEEYVIPNKTKDSKEFSLWVSSKISYKDLAKLVAKELNTDYRKIRINACYNNVRYPLKSNSILESSLLKNFSQYEIPPFEYELLSIPLSELENLKSIKIYWMKDNYIHTHVYEFSVVTSCNIKELKEKLVSRVPLDNKLAPHLLLWANINHCFSNVFFDDNFVEEISPEMVVLARVLPEEVELIRLLEESVEEESQDLSVSNYKKHGKLVIVVQYFKDLSKTHGISFLFRILPEESLFSMKNRLHACFGLGQKEFMRIKLGIIMHRDNKLIDLSDKPDDEIDQITPYDIMEPFDYICLDHPDRSRQQSTFDRPIMIKN
ncbi:related to Ubiquitin carboxyl-terminal hydrolase 15 [Saccharomycodes ludwigii]|uniref:ubiquitinyl hydrolase 1 n=1 Tax=Saccharomycodes ludwigii TaxID=36035 RepID=A0A376B6H5_9ASCO|nr:related to Ubiquitin carboxyl-terminal hydrolase 15 [Saccharomycodes ludwigii]